MNGHWERLNTWYLDLAIVADAIGHVLQDIEEPEGLSAVAHVLRQRLGELVESCPFPDSDFFKTAPPAAHDLDFDFDGSLPADADGVPAELLTGGRHD